MSEVKVKKLPNSQVELTIKIDNKVIEKDKKKAATDYNKKNPISGFRPGKAPYEKIKEGMGKEELIKRALDIAVRESYANAVVKNNIQAIGAPEIKLEDYKPNENLKYKAIVDVFPKIELCDIKKLKIKKLNLKSIKVQDKEIDEAIDKLKESKTKLITVNRETKKGDRVEVDFKLFFDNVPYEGGSSKNHPIILGQKSNKFIPGFEDNLLGMKENEEKSFRLTFPQNYHDKKLKGKEGKFEVKIKLVQERQLPKVDIEFAKNFGEYKTVDEFKNKIKKNILHEKTQKELNDALEKLIDKIIDNSKVEIPLTIVEDEKNKMFQELEMSVAQMGMSTDEYLNHLKKKKSDLLKDWETDAKKRISAVLIFQEIFKKENLKITPSDIDSKIAIMKVQQPELTKGADEEKLKSYAQNLLVNDKAINWLKLEILAEKKNNK